MGEWILVVVLIVSGRSAEEPPRLGLVPQIDSAIIYRDRAACEAALAVKERELRGQLYGLACLPAGRLP